MSKRDNLLLLGDILEAALKIKKYVSNYDLESFQRDEKTLDAVARNFEIIGEAANRIDSDFKSRYPYLHWNRMTGLRNRIVHEYFGIDQKIVWSIIQNDLDKLINEIKILIKETNS